MKKTMVKACATASGGVFFVEDTLRRKKRPISYSDLTEEQKPRIQETRGLFTSVLPRFKTRQKDAA